MRVHASCVAIEGRGILLRGPSGSGKSDLALRLLDGGARLVADDQVELSLDGDRVVARAPAALAGLLEVRGIGIVAVPAVAAAPLALLVDLVPGHAVERLPEPDRDVLLGVAIPRVMVDPGPPSAAAKIRLAVDVGGREMLPE